MAGRIHRAKYPIVAGRSSPGGCLVIIIAGIILLIGSVGIVRAFF